MNEQFKMSDVFGDGFSLWNESGFINDGESDLGSMSCNSFTDAAVIAINSYDQHIELIAKQAEQLKIMHDCIAEIRGGGLLLSEIEAMCDKVINPTKLAIDKLTQAEQIKMLREALELVRPDIYYNQDGEEVCAGGIFTIDENGDADNESMQQIHEALSATEQK